MSNKPRRKRRCAIYTRKSSDEGLEQDFNSLDAQREACAAYIASQKHEGWTCLPDLYDDGGISGATLERPALQQLLSDIRARKIDVVVVYKVDRLTRALADFAKIVEIFDAHKVSFVSVTQQFNTTSSMGRLTLNVLLSFAQFEREVTAERIRDKIAASKRKGMWMGGTVPLGYDAKDRTLVINEAEAETVRALFRLYLELGNVHLVTEEANRRGLRTKLRPDLDGKMRGGRTFFRGHIYRILTNPVYIGRIPHKNVTYPGLHPAIIDDETWTAVQRMMDRHRVARRNRTNARHPSPLAGKLFDDKGNPFTPTHAVKNGRRYRYYVERAATQLPARKTEEPGPRSHYRRIAAHEIEGIVADALRHLLQRPTELLDICAGADIDPACSERLVKSAARLVKILSGPDEHRRSELLRAIISKVVLSTDRIEVTLSVEPLRRALKPELTSMNGHAATHRVSLPLRLRYRGGELKLVLADPNHRHEPNPDPVLIKALVKAHAWLDRVLADDPVTLKDIARRDGVTDRYMRAIMELAFLAPDIQQTILDGYQPPNMTTESLIRGATLPSDWRAQRHVLGITD